MLCPPLGALVPRTTEDTENGCRGEDGGVPVLQERFNVSRSADFFLLRFELFQKLLIGRTLDDFVELGPVVRDQAHAVKGDVVDQPAPVPGKQPVHDERARPHLRLHLAQDDLAVRIETDDVEDVLADVDTDVFSVMRL